MKYSGIGGQAVLEGIMMKSGDEYAVGVRRPDGGIEVKTDEYVSFVKRHPIAALPFVRGVFAFADSMILGLRALTWSASFYEDDEEETPSRFEKWLDRVFGDRLEKVLMGFSMAVAFLLAIVIFLWVPLAAAELMRRFIASENLIAVLEGVLRILIFIAYIKLISRTEDIRRTFMYHGAEHKCINCVEHGLPLSVDNVALSSKEHKRCGTSFIFIVMIISILFFMVIRVGDPLLRFGVRLLLIPVIAGVSYEFLSLAGRSDNPVVNLLSKPGMWMQGLTTKEPTRDMIEVAIAAVNAVFDWKAYEKENFPDGPDALGRALLEKAEKTRAASAASEKLRDASKETQPAKAAQHADENSVFSKKEAV